MLSLSSKICANLFFPTGSTSSRCISQTKMEETGCSRRQELVHSATQMMVTDEFYDGKPGVDLSEQVLIQGLKAFAGVGAKQTNDEEY